MTRPSVVHVYSYGNGVLDAYLKEEEKDCLYEEYLGAYVPRDEQLSHAIVEAVKAYQESYLTLQGLKGVDEKRKIEWQRSKGYNEIGTKRALFRAIEADAKGGG